MATSTPCAHHAAGFLAGGAGLERKELKNSTEKATRDLIPAVPCILELFGFFFQHHEPLPLQGRTWVPKQGGRIQG